MLSILQQLYLQEMDVDYWLERKKEISSLSSPLTLEQLEQTVSACTRCPLSAGRSNSVFARGNANAQLMIIGEAPGYHEDLKGLPFVGRAGQLLDKMLQSIGLTEQDVYIANVLKCRPPNNRDPQSEEINQCRGYLDQQIDLVKPKFLLGLGRFAGQFLKKKSSSLNQLRGSIDHYNDIPFLVSYHPAYLLRNPSEKKNAFIDLRLLKKQLS